MTASAPPVRECLLRSRDMRAGPLTEAGGP